MSKYFNDTNWSIDKWTGSSWTSDGTIPAPAITPIDDVVTAASEYITLADGGVARITPEKKYRIEHPLKLTFSRFTLTEAIRNRLDGYVKNQTPLKLHSHDGFTYKGYVTQQTRNWLLERHKDHQRYQMSWEFRLFDIDNIGVIISGSGTAL